VSYRALDDHVRKNGTGKPLVQTFLALRNEIETLKQVIANQEKRIRDLEMRGSAEVLPPLQVIGSQNG
jgi:hypothetical protein